MATVSTFNIALIASTGRFVSSIAKAERQWNSFSRSVQRQAKTLPKSIREAVPASLALGRNVVKWTAVASAALTGLGAAGVKLAADFEQSQIAFETLLGSAERANRFLRELEVYARRTPFGFVGLQQASRQLLAYGFTAGRVLDMIEPIGDAVAAMGGSNQMFEAIIRALGQIQAKGKLAAQEFLQLTEQGIPAWQMLAEAIGVTVPEAMELASRGVITSAQAIDAILAGMTRRFGGAMERQADTILGRWEQIKDGLATITRGFGEDVIRILGVGRAMEALAGAVERFADAVSLRGFLTALREAFPPWVQPVIVAIAGAIIGGLVPAIVAWLIPALKKLGVSLWATLRPLTPWMAVGAAVALTAYLLARNWNNLADVGQRVWTVLGGVALYGASLVVRGSALIYQALSWVIPALQGTAESVMAYANSLRDSALRAIQSATASARVAQQAAESASTAEQAAQAQETLAAGLEAAQKAAEGGIQSFDEVHQVQESLLDSFEVPEIMPLDVALPELDTTVSMADGLAALEGVITSISEAASRAWDRLTQSMEPVRQAVEWLRREWPGLDVVLENTASIITLTLIPALVTVAARATWSAAQQVAAWVTTQAQAIASIATQVANIAVLAARWIWLGAVAVAQGARVAAGWVAAMGPIGWAIAAAAALAAAIWYYWEDIVAAVASAQAWFDANVAPVWDRIVAAVVTAWNTLSQAAAEIWAGIQAVVEAVVTWAAETVGAAWEAVTGAVSATWQALAAAASSAWSAVQTAVRAVLTWAESTIGAAWQAVSEAVVAVWVGLQSAAETAWNAIRTAVQTALDWAGSAVSAAWDAVSSAVTAVWNGLVTAAEVSWGAVRSAISVVWSWASDTAATVWDGVTNTIRAAWDRLAQAAEAVWSAIRAAIEAVWNWVSGTASAVWDTVTDVISAAWGRLTTVAATSWAAVRQTIAAVWDWATETASSVWSSVEQAVTQAWESLLTAARTTWDAMRSVWDEISTTTLAAWTAVKKTIEDMTKAVESLVNNMRQRVIGWWDDLKNSVVERAQSMVSSVTGFFQNLYNTLVGHSIVPDLVNKVIAFFGSLKSQSVAIVADMGQGVVNNVGDFADKSVDKMKSFGQGIQSITQQISSGMQSVFGQAFDGIISGSMTMGEAFQSVLSGMGAVLKNVLVQQLSQAASNALSTLGSWIISVLSKVATAISAVITQAYTTLVAFYAWSGPAAPVLAAGTIAAAIAGIGALAAKAVGAFKGVTGLAKGGIVTGPTLAMVGEGHRREAVIPLERDNVIAESVGAAVFDAMITAHRFQQASGPGPAGDDREVVLRIDGATFARLILPHLVREGQRQGMDVVIRPALGV